MPRLLVSDDASILSELERTFVRRQGFTLRVLSSGREMLECAADGADLIIVTRSLTDMTGIEFCARLRGANGAGAIPVLLLGAPEERTRALAAGANAFLEVPWARTQLLSLVRDFVSVSERGAMRAEISTKVVCGNGAESYVAFTKDISATGLFLKGASLATPGTRLSLRLRLPGDASEEEVHLSAEVVRSVPRAGESHTLRGMGVRFLDFPLIRKVPITRFVREHSAE